MSHTSVSSCVLAIIASFSGGLDVLKKARARRKQTKRSNIEKLSSEEMQLIKSLQQGPGEIGRQYHKSVQAAGDQVAVGDAIAQTSLAEILLRLNAGLVSIISSFINSDRNDVDLDYRSLTNLSERSCMETCRALRQLHRRSMNMHLPPPVVSREDSFHDVAGPAEEEKSNPRHRRQPRKPAHTSSARNPTLARITIQNSSKPSQIALVKPATRRKKSSSTSELSKVSSKASSKKATSPARPSRPSPSFAESRAAPSTQRSLLPPVKSTARIKQHHSRNSITKSPPTRLATMIPRPSADAGPAVQSPPVSARIPPETVRRRIHVPTYYSVASDGTKIGEIPLEEWAEKFDFEAMAAMNREAEVNGWPRVPLASTQKQKKSRTGLLSVFRRKDR